MIIQGFDPQRITGGHSGFLRQEFRELELLDEITRLRYLGKLPHSELQTRRALIHWFRTLKGEDFVPKATHAAIRWSKDDPMELEEPDDDVDFELLKKSDETKKKEKAQKHRQLNQVANYIPAKGSKALKVASDEPGRRCGVKPAQPKQTEKADRFTKAVSKKKQREIVQRQINSLQGFIWNDTLSCAYDSV